MPNFINNNDDFSQQGYQDPSQSASVDRPPSYLQYAQLHTDANNQSRSWLDPEKYTDAVSNVGKFMTVSAFSGAAGIYNSGVAVANWFGADAEKMDTATSIANNLDGYGDFSQYYKDHKGSADAMGFMLGSLIPGMAGVKILNAGQTLLRGAAATGILGEGLSAATGLLAPSAELYKANAALDIARGVSAFNGISGNALKAIAAGYGQSALETAAFETAATAAQFKSTTLDDQTTGEIASNVFKDSLVFGAIGGVIRHAMVGSEIRTTASKFSEVENQFKPSVLSTDSQIARMSPSDSVIAKATDFKRIQAIEVPNAETVAAGQVDGTQALLAGRTGDDLMDASSKIVGRMNQLKSNALANLRNGIYESYNAMSGSDNRLGNLLGDLAMPLDADQIAANTQNLVKLDRVGVSSPTDILMQGADRANAKPGLLDKITGMFSTPAVQADTNKMTVQFTKLLGEDAGTSTLERPKVLSMADVAKDDKGVDSIIDGFKFKQVPDKAAEESLVHMYDPADISVTPMQAEAHAAWVDKNLELKSGMQLHSNDVNSLAKLYTENPWAKEATFEAHLSDMSVLTSKDEAFSALQRAKDQIIGVRGLAAQPATAQELAVLADVKESYLSGAHSADLNSDLLARNSAKQAYAQQMQQAGMRPDAIASKLEDWDYTPKYAKAVYNTSDISANAGNEVRGMTQIAARAAAEMQVVKNAVASGLSVVNDATHEQSDFAARLQDINQTLLPQASREGSAPGLFSFNNQRLGSFGSVTQQIGSVMSDLKQALQGRTAQLMNPVVSKLAQTPEAAVEFASINKQLASTGEQYVYDAANKQFVHTAVWDAMQSGGEMPPPQLAQGIKPMIPVSTDEAANAFEARMNHVTQNGGILQDLRNAQGLTSGRRLDAYIPVRPNLSDFQHFAIVRDPTLAAQDAEHSMIHAATPEDLNAMIQKVKQEFPQYEVYTKDQTADYFKAHGEFDWERTLNQVQIDSNLQRKGIMNSTFIQTDPTKIAQSLMADHMTSDRLLAQELVSARYQPEMDYLRNLSGGDTSVATSTFGKASSAVSDPYGSYIKTMLDQQQSEGAFKSLNVALDQKVSQAWFTLKNAFNGVGSANDFDKVSQYFDKYGVNSALNSADIASVVNADVPRGVLNNFVKTANSIVTALVTRTNPINALNNVIGHSIMNSTELNSLVRSINNGDEAAVGDLAKLANIKLPGTSDQVFSPAKLIGNALSNLVSNPAIREDGTTVADWMAQRGFDPSLGKQMRSVLSELAIKPESDAAGFMAQRAAGADQAIQFLEKWSGNKAAEHFNRFVAADVMRQVTDVALQHGLIGEGDQLAYINTFVNRVAGNIVASQRPMAFQGPIGQAIGLFQSYQFNMMQQLLRHVGEGSGKDVAMMLGLQGTFYGLNGLPEFQAINQHLIGTRSGNTEHTDAYSMLYGGVGKDAGDWLLYGAPSKILGANMYSHGDMNARNTTILPLNPTDVPFVKAFANAFTSIKGMVNNVQDGGDMWNSFLGAVEHNGISRPMAGIAQTARAITSNGTSFSTTGAGNISSANDLFSWAGAVRLIGAKPLDEAITNDALFRYSAYHAADMAKLDDLGKSLKTTVVDGGMPTHDQVANFASQYAQLGGTQQQFNKWMMGTITKATTPQADAIMKHLQTPGVQNLQKIMGGRDPLDVGGQSPN